MDFPRVENISSDSDVTVVLVKKSLDPNTDSNGGDCKRSSAISLINFATCNRESKIDSESITSCSLKPLSSWDPETNVRWKSPDSTISSYKIVNGIRKTKHSRSDGSTIHIKSIQNAYTDSDTSTVTSESNNNAPFVDVNLNTSSDNTLMGRKLSKNSKSENRMSLFNSCFPCFFKNKSAVNGPIRHKLKKADKF